VLTDNFLTGNELKHLSELKQVTAIKLGGNKIKTLDDLNALVSFLMQDNLHRLASQAS
jgi:hypothetical protein